MKVSAAPVTFCDCLPEQPDAVQRLVRAIAEHLPAGTHIDGHSMDYGARVAIGATNAGRRACVGFKGPAPAPAEIAARLNEGWTK